MAAPPVGEATVPDYRDGRDKPGHDRAKFPDIVRTAPTKISERVSSKPHRGPIEIIRLGALDLDGGEFADAERAARGDVDGAVDLRGIALAAALGDGAARPRRSAPAGGCRPGA